MHTRDRRDAAATAIDAFLSDRLGVDREPDHEPLIVAFGSMARDEMSPGSDFDYLVVLDRLARDPSWIQVYREAAREGLRTIGAEVPGQSGLFGVAISATDLVNTIGLDTDSNLHLSRRVLLLEESVPLNADAAWRRLVEAVAARYLYEHVKATPSVPRFLFNDVARYWRTIAVDYQAKRWEELTGNKWGLRYAKLITTRKFLFAAMVSTLFSPVVFDVPVSPKFLVDQCSMPALARLAQLAPHLGDDGQAALGQLLSRADEVVGRLASAEFRESMKGVKAPASEPAGSSTHEVRQLAEKVQSDLELLFFSDEPLRNVPSQSLGILTRRYLAF
jgi:predicted nucleotidyltransferase